MNHEAALKLQAWVDGELSAPGSREMADWVKRDPEAGALATELRHTQTALSQGEPEYTVPLSREYYWSAIERQITRSETPTQAGVASQPFAWLVRFLAPAAILTTLALLLALPGLRGLFATPNTWASEVDSPLEDISSVTFRSESEGMTVVWVNTR